MSDVLVAGPKLDVGLVLRTTFDVTRRNLRAFALPLLLFAVVPGAITGGLEIVGAHQNDAAAAGSLSGIVNMVTGTLVQTAMAALTLASLEGRSLSPRAALLTATRTLGSMLLINLMVGIAVVFGLLLLVIPGVLWGAMWAVALPARLSGSTKAAKALDRSAALTRGQRWRVLAVLAIYWILFLAMALALTLLTMLVETVAGKDAGSLASNILNGVLVGLLSGPIFAVLYVELRRLKEGAVDTASVFD